MREEPGLVIDDLHVWRGGSHVLQGVSLALQPGRAACLLGRNGVGKSTFVAAVMGWLPRLAGSIRLAGDEVLGRKAYELARLGIAIVPQGRRLFTGLTVEENLAIVDAAGQHNGSHAGTGWTVEECYGRFPALQDRRAIAAGNLSGGEQQMLAIARAMRSFPRLLILDEPSEGLSPMIVDEVATVLRDIAESGTAVLLVEQNLRLALDVALDAYIMDRGSIVWAGLAVSLESSPGVIGEHLGVQLKLSGTAESGNSVDDKR